MREWICGRARTVPQFATAKAMLALFRRNAGGQRASASWERHPVPRLHQTGKYPYPRQYATRDRLPKHSNVKMDFLMDVRNISPRDMQSYRPIPKTPRVENPYRITTQDTIGQAWLQLRRIQTARMCRETAGWTSGSTASGSSMAELYLVRPLPAPAAYCCIWEYDLADCPAPCEIPFYNHATYIQACQDTSPPACR